MIAIEARKLGFMYAGSSSWVLKDIDLEIYEREFVLLAGRSGCGKSTLLRCFNGLIPYFYEGELEGEVKVYGLDTRNHPPYILSQYAGMVFQNPDNQLFALTVEADIAFALENLSLPRDEIRERVDWALKVMGIEDLRDKSPNELSGGQKQKVAIASILAMKPKIIILDEPTSSLDPASAKQLIDTIAELNYKLGITIIIAEHRLDMLLPYVNRLIVMNDGRIVFQGNPRDILEKYDVMPYGVPVPRVVRVAQQLKKTLSGSTISRIPLTVDELVQDIRRWRSGK
ncbi:MAG: energy-coupling factor ABC transporter ATP-binding protein [Aigarchaeota archaeon]|nr:energy-coupling factor ABC transporter ATP-binding protein [Aigarchaeota archaeon]MCX8193621.1 energy-coupling factor ABC transporter ATP-binding protein [Nitrososphaeria archaeon]MDW7987021.1 ABC transporter ATP-binding protein [Nitrososphaerota archaeon]